MPASAPAMGWIYQNAEKGYSMTKRRPGGGARKELAVAAAQFKRFLIKRRPAVLLFGAFSLLVLMGLVYSLVVYQALRERAEGENLAADLAQAENCGYFIGDHQKGVLGRLAVIAARNAFRQAIVQRDLAELYSFLGPLWQDTQETDAVFVAGPAGDFLVGLPRQQNPPLEPPGLTPGAVRPTISPAHESHVEQGRLVVTLSAPVLTPDGAPVGYLAIVQRADLWQGVIERLSVRPGRSIFVFDQKQRLIFSNLTGRPAQSPQGRLALDQARKMLAGGGRALAALEQSPDDGKRYFAAAAPVAGLGWSVALAQDYDAAMAPAHAMFMNIVFFMGLLLLCLLFLSFLVMSRYRMQQRMLTELDEEARRLEGLVQQRTADLRHTTERYRNLVQDLPDVVYELDAVGRVTFVSKAVSAVLGYEPGDMLGILWRDFVSGEDRAHFDEERRRAHSGEKISIMALRHLTKNGRLRWLSIHSRALLDHDGNPTGRLGVARDVTSEVMAERKIRELSGRLINAQEEERKRIALDLHDEMGQILSALKIGLQSLAQREENQREDINQLIALAQRVMDQTRALAYHLRPAILDNFGLVAALEDLCESMSESKLLAVEYNLQPIDEDLLPPGVRTSLFRFAQEALTNAVKHSGSLRVEVSLAADEGAIELCVRDWGKGFNVAQALDAGKHLGLAGMRERISLIGGRLLIDSNFKGSTLKVRAPIGGRR